MESSPKPKPKIGYQLCRCEIGFKFYCLEHKFRKRPNSILWLINALPPLPYFQEYNLVNHVGTSQETAELWCDRPFEPLWNLRFPKLVDLWPASPNACYVFSCLYSLILTTVGNPLLPLTSNREQDAPVDFSVLDAAVTKREMRYEYYLILILTIV